jgi:hypothetical protein
MSLKKGIWKKKKKRHRISLLPEKGEEAANNLRDYGGEDQNIR